jgi:exodeoxyribonuclease VII small subunit
MRKKKTWNYEVTVTQIEEIINQIESGSLPLENVFEKFAIAVEYLRQCESFLNQGKDRMNLLIETLEEEPEF